VRRVTLSNPQENTAITIVPASPVQLSTRRYSLENMMAALHTFELADLSAGADGCYYLHLDCAQRGVGTATCGPDTREQYRVRPGVFRMRLYISND
jgi:beta-galactosidase